MIETAQPSIDYTQRKYGDAHDAVVASATYNRALEAAAEVLQRLQVRHPSPACLLPLTKETLSQIFSGKPDCTEQRLHIKNC